jgi:tRNA1Val (adenine37-N6)-methyltransferase
MLTETLAGGTLLYTGGAFPVTSDALMLARFAAGHLHGGPLRPEWSACDLGSGCGVLLLSLLDAGLRGRAVGVDRSAEGTALLRAAALAGGFANVEAVRADLCHYTSPTPVDLVIANPPYHSTGALPAGADRAAARHDRAGAGINEICAAAARLLKDGGRLLLCWPPGRMASLFAALHAARLAPRVLQLARHRPSDEPWLLLLDARKAAGEGLYLLPDMIDAGQAAGTR